MKATWSAFQSSFGTGAVICHGDRIARVLLPEREKSIATRVEMEAKGAEERQSDTSLAGRIAVQLGRAMAGQGDLGEWADCLEWPVGSPFRLAVLQACARIPRGQVRSYGDLASDAGYPGRARAAGTVMATNPLPLVIPCHRVLRSDGAIGHYGGGADMKRRLLEAEGALPGAPA